MARSKYFKWTEAAEHELITRSEAGASLGDLQHHFPECTENALRHKIGELSQQRRAEVTLCPPIDDSVTVRDRMRALEVENARLREQLTWAQEAKSDTRTGGLLTLRRSDDHHADRNHLLSCGRSLTEKFLVVVGQYEPDAIQIIAGDDWIAGKGIYKNQDLDSVTTDLDDQLALGAWKARQFIARVREVSTAPIVWRVIRGNHSYVQGESLMESLFDKMAVACADLPDVKFVYHGDSLTANLADCGTYNVLVRHGFGYSPQSPNSASFVSAIKDEILNKQSRMQPSEQYRRVISGHTHWLSVGLDRLPGLTWDTTGGLQRNTRVRIGDNQRPVGWIVYASPRGMDSEILNPIAVKPDADTYDREMADPFLGQANMEDCVACLRDYRAWREGRGDFGPADSYGKLNSGRW